MTLAILPVGNGIQLRYHPQDLQYEKIGRLRGALSRTDSGDRPLLMKSRTDPSELRGSGALPDHSYFENLIWRIADLLRGPYRPPQVEGCRALAVPEDEIVQLVPEVTT